MSLVIYNDSDRRENPEQNERRKRSFLRLRKAARERSPHLRQDHRGWTRRRAAIRRRDDEVLRGENVLQQRSVSDEDRCGGFGRQISVHFQERIELPSDPCEHASNCVKTA